MNRRERVIKCFGQKWKIKSIFPADFLSVSYWPFSYYRLPEIKKRKDIPEVKRDWKKKPKEMEDMEAKLNASIKHAFFFGLSVFFDSKFEEIKKNDQLYNVLLAEIYALSYDLSATDKYFSPFKILSKDFAEALAIKAKFMNVEPYSLIADVSRETPELYNPKRFDFNWLILSAGWECERREREKAEREIRSRMRRK